MKVTIAGQPSASWVGIAKGLLCAGLALAVVWSCSPAERPTEAKVAPPQAIEYSKFVVYTVGGGAVNTIPDPSSSLPPRQIPYIVGEDFFPSRYIKYQLDYNTLNRGDGSDNPDQFFYYRDFNPDDPSYDSRKQRGASDHPDAVVIDNELKLFFTNQPCALVDPFTQSCIPLPKSPATLDGNTEGWKSIDKTPDAPLAPGNPRLVYINLNSYVQPTVMHADTSGCALVAPPCVLGTMDGDTEDVDVLAFEVPRDHTVVNFRTAGHQYNKAKYLSLELTLIGSDRTTVLAKSHAGFDLFSFEDPEIGYNFDRAGTYFLEIKDLNYSKKLFKDPALDPPFSSQNSYFLFCESITTSFEGEAFIRRGDIQPARSGNPNLDGGDTFEPDDIETVIEDLFPDCDGIANSGDEGDWGVNEKCGEFVGSGTGAQDGAIQYLEIDDKTTIDDGEYFTAKDTNIRSLGQEAPSVMVAPENDKLWMWINAGGAIYQLESLDGLAGLEWDLSNIFENLPALKAGDNPDPDSPVVSSGIYGFCDTKAEGDDTQKVELCSIVNTPLGCRGYPDTIAVTNGEDGILQTPAQEDTLDARQNAITSGPDGIVNTFFLPTHLHYGGTIDIRDGDSIQHPYWAPSVDVTVKVQGGIANPDMKCATNPSIAGGDSVSGANDANAYLLGDDLWSPALKLTPARFWRLHNCVFFSLGDDLNNCAMGIPDTVAVRPGPDGRLDTVEEMLSQLGDDQLCHEGEKVGVCPGPDGRFNWGDIYLPLKGDDTLCIRTDPVLTTDEVAICPGPDGVLQTTVIDTYNPISTVEVGSTIDGDVCCDPFEVAPDCTEICPGPDHQLQSLFILYFNDISLYKADILGIMGRSVVFSKSDAFTRFDDEMCVIGGQIAVCPGQNGYFQSYPVSQRIIEQRYENYEEVLLNFEGLTDDCHALEVEKTRDSFSDTMVKSFILYRNEGVMFDDQIRWDPVKGEYYISTGENGINQTCQASGDQELIPRWRGLPDQPIILPGPNGVLDTPPLKDELVQIPLNGLDLFKISTGEDGVANSFALGDDRMEIFLGTGKPDWPCVLAGANGIAETSAKGNDTQTFRPGEKTGFDAYQVGYPDVVREGDQLYMFYTGLGWAQIPPSERKNSAGVNKIGECDRAGMDNLWGGKDVKYQTIWKDSYNFISPTPLSGIGERTLVTNSNFNSPRYSFLHILDNNQGVLLAPRIGVATSTVERIERNPSDWDKQPKPIIDIGKFCAMSAEASIDLGFDMPQKNSVHYNGAFSSDTFIYHEQSDGQPIFLMMFTGMNSDTENETADDEKGLTERFSVNVSVARSLDGLTWDVAYDLGNILASGETSLAIIIGSISGGITEYNYANPTIANGEGNSFNLFFKQYNSLLGDLTNNGFDFAQFGPDTRSWIGFAVRKGEVSKGALCLDLAGSDSLQKQNTRETILSLIMIAVPVLIGLGWRLFRRNSQLS